MAAASSSALAVAEVSFDGPTLKLFTKHLRAQHKKLKCIVQMEEALVPGKQFNPEKSEVHRSKTTVLALIDEFDKLCAPLSDVVADKITINTSTPLPPPLAALTRSR